MPAQKVEIVTHGGLNFFLGKKTSFTTTKKVVVKLVFFFPKKREIQAHEHEWKNPCPDS
jgi:hypothetical protein